MSDENQIVVPPSFVALFIEPGRIKPNAPREVIAERYELCEDMANMLTEPSASKLWELGITEADVLERTRLGLAASDTGLTPTELEWVLRRLAELLGWDDPFAAD